MKCHRPILHVYNLLFAKIYTESEATIYQLPEFYCLLTAVDDVNILGGSVHTVKENAEALLVATKETGLEANADKT
jgi:hypothetical protein